MSTSHIAKTLLRILHNGDYPRATVEVTADNNIHIRLNQPRTGGVSDDLSPQVRDAINSLHEQVKKQRGPLDQPTINLHFLESLEQMVTDIHMQPAPNVPAYQKINKKNWWHR